MASLILNGYTYFPAIVFDEKLETFIGRSNGSKPVLQLNSRDFTYASGDAIAFQATPSQTVSSSGNLIGGQIKPRLQDGVALTGSGSLIGLHIDTDLKGTTGAIGGDIRGMEIEMVGDIGRTSAVTGDVLGIRFRTNLSTVVGGHVSPLYVLAGEAAGGQWDALCKFSANVTGVWDDTDSGTTSTKAGFIKVLIGTTARYIRLYDAAG